MDYLHHRPELVDQLLTEWECGPSAKSPFPGCGCHTYREVALAFRTLISFSDTSSRSQLQQSGTHDLLLSALRGCTQAQYTVSALGSHPHLSTAELHLIQARRALVTWHDQGHPGAATKEQGQ